MSNLTGEDPEISQADASGASLVDCTQVYLEKPTFQPPESPDFSEAITNSDEATAGTYSPKSFEVCVVCGDKSSGKHYGVFTCEGCKSFFKRSIRRGLVYTCRTFRSCTIDINHRNHCQYCRLQKCINSGMKKEAVQKGRISSTGTDALISAPRGTAQVASMQAFYSNYIALLLRADTIAWLQQSGGVTPNGTGVNNSQELAMSLLITAVEWTRNIPFFQEFMLSDQSGLLRSCWSELFVLNVAQQCTSVTYLTSPYSALSSGTDSEYNENLRVFEEQVAKLKSLQLDATELCCLKAIILFNPDSPGLSNTAYVESLQERTQAAMEDYIRTQHPAQPMRFGKVLLRLPSLRLIRPAVVEGLFFSTLGGSGHGVENAVNEMLLAGSMGNNMSNW